jgi:hypothetical protein
LTTEALKFLAKQEQERIRRAQEIIGPPWIGVVTGPEGAALVDYSKTKQT